MSASAVWVSALTCRRRWPTARVSQANSGSVTSDSTVSCQDSTSIATSVDSRITTLDRMVLAVSVITVCRPPTSLARRDWISPVRVAVKNRSDSDCRCS
jgi:hypothetical protein